MKPSEVFETPEASGFDRAQAHAADLDALGDEIIALRQDLEKATTQERARLREEVVALASINGMVLLEEVLALLRD